MSLDDRAYAAGLITLPPRVVGARCTECRFVDRENSACRHPRVNQELHSGVDRMCCNYYDAPGMVSEGADLDTQMIQTALDASEDE